jgi:hypothetical protein
LSNPSNLVDSNGKTMHSAQPDYMLSEIRDAVRSMPAGQTLKDFQHGDYPRSAVSGQSGLAFFEHLSFRLNDYSNDRHAFSEVQPKHVCYRNCVEVRLSESGPALMRRALNASADSHGSVITESDSGDIVVPEGIDIEDVNMTFHIFDPYSRIVETGFEVRAIDLKEYRYSRWFRVELEQFSPDYEERSVHQALPIYIRSVLGHCVVNYSGMKDYFIPTISRVYPGMHSDQDVWFFVVRI